MNKKLIRWITYSLLAILILATIFLCYKTRSNYYVTLSDLARLGNPANSTFLELKKSVVQISSNSGIGTGVIVYADKFFIYILTNDHVMNEAKSHETEVRFLGDIVDTCIKYPIEIGYEIDNDLSMIAVCRKTENFTIAELSDKPAKIGDELFTIGFPIGIPHFYSKGSYSANVNYKFFRSDITVAPGASGSPVFNKQGKLVGLVRGLNRFKIPSNKTWQDIFSKEKEYYLVRYGVCIRYKRVKFFMEKMLNGRKKV